MDENYQTYLNRVARQTLPVTYESLLQHIQESPKFQPHPDGGRKAVPFPGYTVITPPGEEDSTNSGLYQSLQNSQEQLLQQLPNLIVPIPASSFHLTLADLIWDSAYRDAVSHNPDFEVQLHSAIAKSFEQCKNSSTSSNPIRWQLLGLVVMPRAIGVGLAPKDEDAYERILQLRRAIYQNPSLIALGIEQQYLLNAHITVGYFGEISPDLDRDRLSQILSELNNQWLDNPQELLVERAELRKFDDMTRYYRQQDYPVLEF